MPAYMRDASNNLDEQRFLAEYDQSKFPRPSVTVDVALLCPSDGDLRTLISRRSDFPFKNEWALPGGFVGIDESLDEAAARVLRDKAGLRDIFLEQLYTFGDPNRDPRGWVITVSYYALVPASELEPSAPGTQLARVRVPWEGDVGGPVTIEDAQGNSLPLAFDHEQIVGVAVKRIRGKLDYTPIGFELLPETFTLFDLQQVHETVLGRDLNKDSFRRRMLASGLLEPTGDAREGTAHRQPALYRRKKH
ncbi:MAG TPA: NUDIX domain-containing protein [Candidatus Baltobacteraceae bacterium]